MTSCHDRAGTRIEPPSQYILSHYDIQAPLPRVNTWRSATVTLDTHNTPRDLSAHPASHPPPAPPSQDDSVLLDALEEPEVLEHVRANALPSIGRALASFSQSDTWLGMIRNHGPMASDVYDTILNLRKEAKETLVLLFLVNCLHSGLLSTTLPP